MSPEANKHQLMIVKNIAGTRGMPVIQINVRMPVDLHERLLRAMGEVMVYTGNNVSKNATVIALLSDALDRLERDQTNGSGSS